jgi:hypothetical protein
MIDLLSVRFLAWVVNKLWAPRPTHQVLGLPRSLAGRVLEELDALDDETPTEVVHRIHSDARETFRLCLRERGVPENAYELVIRNPILGHRVRRHADDCSWSLIDFDDFIDLGLKPRGTQGD